MLNEMAAAVQTALDSNAISNYVKYILNVHNAPIRWMASLSEEQGPSKDDVEQYVHMWSRISWDEVFY